RNTHYHIHSNNCKSNKLYKNIHSKKLSNVKITIVYTFKIYQCSFIKAEVQLEIT
uniref:Uncharacterized protein n=1 Tax=Ciona intestinalis TaxID=7719 RepID=H2XMT8_CIOIN